MHLFGGVGMRKIIAFVLAALVLTGCERKETVRCYNCGDQVDRWISTWDESVCATCFAQYGYQICLDCGLAYDADDWDAADGYCANCADENTWNCSICEECFDVDDLAEIEPGYFLCAGCVYSTAKPFDNAFKSTYGDYISPFDLSETSPFASRNDYLEIETDAAFEDDESSIWDEDVRGQYFSNYDEGYNAGFDKGYDAGYGDGYDEGEGCGYSEGYEAAKQYWYDAGYSDGVDAGVKSAKASASVSKSETTGSTATTAEKSMTVYITNTGEKYHRYGCQYLKKSCIPIDINDARSSGYTACSRCW